MKLPRPFDVHTVKSEEGMSYSVTLSPLLANYKAILDYDERGNANITIQERGTDKVVLDMSLDTGEINEINEEMFK